MQRNEAIMDYKIYKNVDEQIEYLKNNKRIFVDEEDKHWFFDVNYISLINPYKELFSNGKSKDGSHIYTRDISFKEILKAMKIDYEFSAKLFSDIRNFERKLKNLVFIEMCDAYKNRVDDRFCIQYVDEIQRYISDPSDTNLPSFCPNLSKIITKNGMTEIDKLKPARIDLLTKIYSYGSGYSGDDQNIKQDRLISHYINSQGVAPLWTIPNVLTLGEISMLYSMLDINSQGSIYSAFNNDSVLFDGIVEYKRLARFTGKLEFIRKLRNTINHYEPVLPSLCSMIRKPKEMYSSVILSSLRMLDHSFDHLCNISSKLPHVDLGIDIRKSSKNIVHTQMLELMVLYINSETK